MTALLDRCRALDVRLWVEGGRLRFDAPRGALDADLRADLVANKADLVAALAVEPAVALAEQPRKPDSCAHFHGPPRTRWGTWLWSDPGRDVVPIVVFGPPPAESRP